MPDLPQPPPWQQQPGETKLWFARFERFRRAGPNRSVLGTVNLEQVDKGGRRRTRTPGSWDRAAKRWRWPERADAWDQDQLRAAREAHAAQVREMRERHVQLARGLQAKAVERLRSLSPADLGSQDLLRYLVEAAKLERLALGEPDTLQRQELTGKGASPLEFSLEDAIAAARELEKADHDPVQPDGGPALPQGSPQVP